MAGLVADGGLDDGGCEMNANDMSGGAQSREITTREGERVKSSFFIQFKKEKKTVKTINQKISHFIFLHCAMKLQTERKAE